MENVQAVLKETMGVHWSVPALVMNKEEKMGTCWTLWCHCHQQVFTFGFTANPPKILHCSPSGSWFSNPGWAMVAAGTFPRE